MSASGVSRPQLTTDLARRRQNRRPHSDNPLPGSIMQSKTAYPLVWRSRQQLCAIVLRRCSEAMLQVQGRPHSSNQGLALHLRSTLAL
jgi:hypothetical protein